MRPFYWAILIGVEVWVAAEVALTPFNAVQTSYRRQEREAAFKAREETPSPETRVALQEELQLASRHIRHRQLLHGAELLGGFLVLDVLGACIGKRPTSALSVSRSAAGWW